MSILALGRSTLSASVVISLLAGCGALRQSQSDTQPPLGATSARTATSAQYKVLFQFAGGIQGELPQSGLIDVNGTLYGTTYQGGVKTASCQKGCGIVYSVTTSGSEKTLYDFQGYPSDGESPLGDLLDDNGTLYGTTTGGGGVGQGTIYSISPAGKEKVLLQFDQYGTTRGHEGGALPAAGLIHENGMLYGTTVKGCKLITPSCGPDSTENDGIVYSVTTTGKETILYSFGVSNGANGEWPYAPVIDVNGTLYGTTKVGGESFLGVVYSVSDSGGEHVLHSFGGTYDGAYPVAGLLDVNGTLYGTTEYGGGSSACTNGCGTVFSITPSGTETVLHSFAGGSDGAYPRAALTDVNGTLYGTTAAGGGASGCAKEGCGTIFSISTSGTETVVHSFARDAKGWQPRSELLDVKGTLYGTTYHGGKTARCTAGCGTVFSFVP